MGKHGNIPPKADEACENILHFVECMTTYLIPVGKSDKKIKKASKKIKGLIKDYRKGKVEIFKPEFYEMIDNGDDDYVYNGMYDDENAYDDVL